VLDKDTTFLQNCNSENLNISGIELEEDKVQLKQLIENHYKATSSPLGKRIVENWEIYLPKFIKVLPEEYRQALVRLEEEKLETA
jgi:glutamate synthase (NADPH/NADH) large chain